MQPMRGRGSAGGCLLEEPRRQSAAGIAPQIPKRVELGLAWTQVPRPALKRSWMQHGAPRMRGRATPSPREPRRSSGIRKQGAAPWIPGWVCGAPPPQTDQRSGEQIRQQVVGTASTAGLPGRLPSRATRAGSAGLRPPRPGASCGTPTRAATAATREPAARPATPHSLLHSGSPHTLRSEKRRPGLRSGWPGTHQSAPSTSSQESSPGAAAMLWPRRARVTRRPPAGGAGGGAGAGGAGEGAQEAGCLRVTRQQSLSDGCAATWRRPWRPSKAATLTTVRGTIPLAQSRASAQTPSRTTLRVTRFVTPHLSATPIRVFRLPPSASDFWSMLNSHPSSSPPSIHRFLVLNHQVPRRTATDPRTTPHPHPGTHTSDSMRFFGTSTTWSSFISVE